MGADDMPTTYTYHDAYLAALVTEDREDRATAEVASFGTFDEPWLGRLIVLRAYIITCIESQKSAEDVFAAKLAAYRKEWTEQLPLARAAAAAAAEAAGGSIVSGASFFTVPLERG